MAKKSKTVGKTAAALIFSTKKSLANLKIRYNLKKHRI